MQCRLQDVLPKNARFRHKGAWPRSRDLLLNFGTLYIPGTAEATNFKFVVQFAFIQLKVMWAISLFPCHIYS